MSPMPETKKTWPKLMGAGAAAATLGVTRQTLSRWVAEGRIVPVGQLDVRNGAMIFRPSDVEKLNQERVDATT